MQNELDLDLSHSSSELAAAEASDLFNLLNCSPVSLHQMSLHQVAIIVRD